MSDPVRLSIGLGSGVAIFSLWTWTGFIAASLLIDHRSFAEAARDTRGAAAILFVLLLATMLAPLIAARRPGMSGGKDFLKRGTDKPRKIPLRDYAILAVASLLLVYGVPALNGQDSLLPVLVKGSIHLAGIAIGILGICAYVSWWMRRNLR